MEKLQFPALDITGTNYISWVTNVELHLESLGLSETVKEINTSTPQEKAKSVIFLRRHLDESIIYDYANMRDPKELWKSLKDRFDHQKDITLPLARDEWQSLRFQDFDKVMNIDRDMWIKEISMHDDLFYKLYDRLPKEMAFIRELLVSNLWRSPELGLAAPRVEPADKDFEKTKNLEAERAVPDKAAATAE